MLELADKATDKELERISKRLYTIYGQASKEITEKTESYFSKFYDADAKKQAEVASGKLSKEAYREWREQKVFVGERWRSLERQTADRLTVADKIAMDYVNGRLPSVYSKNYNAVAKAVNGIGAGVRFDLLDEHTVKFLATNDKTLLPYKTVDGKKAERWHTEQVNAQVTQGIIQGESMQKIAKRLEKNVGMTAEGSAIRNAQVAVGGAQNKGRVDMMKAAKGKGIISKKRWTSLHDGRTRHAHKELDGVEADLDEAFVNSIGPIEYPRSPDAAPSNVYGCRCRIIPHIMGVINKETGSYTDLSGIQTFREVPMTEKTKKKAVATAKKAAATVSTSAKTYNNEISRDIGEDNYKKYREKLDECENEDVKAVYEAFADDIGVLDSSAKGGAFHRRGSINWNAQKDLAGSSQRKPMSTFYHETGHANDYFLGQKTMARTGMFSTSWENGRFSTTIRDEVNDWVDSVDKRLKAEFKANKTNFEWLKANNYISSWRAQDLDNIASRYGVTVTDILGGKVKLSSWEKQYVPKYSKDNAYSEIEKELRQILYSDGGDYKIHSLSDIVGGVTKLKINAGWGHDRSYWKDHDPAVEAYAEMGEAYVTGPESLQTLKKYLPKSVACFDEMTKYARGLL